jgi:hypothetical protein
MPPTQTPPGAMSGNIFATQKIPSNAPSLSTIVKPLTLPLQANESQQLSGKEPPEKTEEEIEDEEEMMESESQNHFKEF